MAQSSAVDQCGLFQISHFSDMNPRGLYGRLRISEHSVRLTQWLIWLMTHVNSSPSSSSLAETYGRPGAIDKIKTTQVFLRRLQFVIQTTHRSTFGSRPRRHKTTVLNVRFARRACGAAGAPTLELLWCLLIPLPSSGVGKSFARATLCLSDVACRQRRLGARTQTQAAAKLLMSSCAAAAVDALAFRCEWNQKAFISSSHNRSYNHIEF